MSKFKTMRALSVALLGIFLVLLAIALMATIARAFMKVLFDYDTMRAETTSWSIEEARSKGTLVCELEVLPAELIVGDRSVRFGVAWLEERSLRTDFLVWFPRYKRVGGYNLYFTLDEGADAVGGYDGWFFVEDDRGAGCVGIKANLFYQRLDTEDVSSVRVSLVRDFRAPRPKNIHFIPRGQSPTR